ncbi:anti-adapter protein IraP, partial [Providencia rettgeri]
MTNLIAELLFKLAQKEEESKELCAQVQALQIIVTAMLHNMAQNDQQRWIDQVEGALYQLRP